MKIKKIAVFLIIQKDAFKKIALVVNKCVQVSDDFCNMIGQQVSIKLGKLRQVMKFQIFMS